MSGAAVLKTLPSGKSQSVLINDATPLNKAVSNWIPIVSMALETFQIIFHIHSAGAAIELEFDFAIQPPGVIPSNAFHVPEIWGFHMVVGSITNGTPVVIPRSIPPNYVVYYRNKNNTNNNAVAFGGAITLCN